MAFFMDADSPGYLTKAQFEVDPEQMQSFSRTDGGEQNNEQASLHMDYRFTDKLSWSSKVYTQSLERSRWVRFSEAGSQQERRTEETQSGAISTLTYKTRDWHGINEATLVWGVDYQYQDDLYKRYTTVDRVRQGAPFRAWDYSQGYLGSYVKADAEATKWLRLMGALRADYLFGEFEDEVNRTESDMVDYGVIWQPKVGAVITPYEGYNLFANYGRNFQVGWTSRFDEENDTDYSKNDGWEVGIKASPLNWLTARAAYWQQIRSDEIVTNVCGDPENLGETERSGWDFGLNLKLHEWITLWGSYSYVNAEYKEPGPGHPDREGRELENIPDYTARVGLDFAHDSGFSSNIWLESQGGYYIDSLNELGRVGDYDVVNLDLKYAFSALTAGFQVRNLFNEDYAGFVWYQSWGAPEIWYSPGDERSYYAYVSLEF